MPNGSLPLWLFGIPEETKTALILASKITSPSRERIIAAIKECGYPFNRSGLRRQAKLLHTELTMFSEDELFSILDALTDLVDAPKDIRREIITYSLKGTDSPVELVEQLIDEISAQSSIAEQRQVSRFTQLVLPRLKDMEHVCAIRARFSESFSYAKDNIEDYNPKISDYHPVVLITLALSGDSEDSTFQLDQDKLDNLIADLIAAQKELRVLTDTWQKSTGDRK